MDKPKTEWKSAGMERGEFYEVRYLELLRQLRKLLDNLLKEKD